MQGCLRVYSCAGAEICEDCPAGRNNEHPGLPICPSCVAGYFSTGGATRCSSCNKGQYQDLRVAESCNYCPVGQFNDRTHQTACRDCGPGSEICWCLSARHKAVIDWLGLSLLPVAHAGKFASGGNIECDACDVGQYTNELRQFNCTICPIGRYQGKRQATACEVHAVL